MCSRRVARLVRLVVFAAALLAVCIFLRLQPNEIKVFRFSKMGTTVTDTYFVARKVNIVMQAPAGTKVYYTTDGSTPDAQGTLYTDPIVLKPAQGDFPNCLLLKAIACYPDGTKSDVVTHTFWAHTQIVERSQVLMLSVSADPAMLTEEPDGILYGDNVWKRGEESEREVHVEAVSAGGKEVFAQNAGARVYGMYSRHGSIQSLKLYARKEYEPGKGKFNTDIFGTLGYDGQIIDSYDKLVVRNSSNSEYDFWCGFFRDALHQRLVEQAGHTDYQQTVPAIMYINGAYYGFFWMHENYCDDFLQQKYGEGKGRFQIIEGRELEKDGDLSDPEKTAAAKEFNAMYRKLAYLDMTDEKNFAEVNAFLDVENYLQNFAYNIYVGNVDWPHNNYKCYRYYAAESEPYGEGHLDGRWRLLYHDLDYSMGKYGGPESSAEYNVLADIMAEDNKRYCPLFVNLMKRTDCREYFLSEIIRLRDGVLSAENVIHLKNQLVQEREEEMQQFFLHLQSLPSSAGSIENANATYEKSMQLIDLFITNRAEHLQAHLIEAFSLPENYFD